jgi:hypothetical protein
VHFLQHPWSQVVSTVSASEVCEFVTTLVVGIVHHPCALGPRPHAQHIQLPPMSLNWQFCSGQPCPVSWAEAKLMLAQGAS